MPTNPTGYEGPTALTTVQVALVLGIGRTKTQELIANGEIPSFRIGAARRVLSTDLEAFLRRSAFSEPAEYLAAAEILDATIHRRFMAVALNQALASLGEETNPANLNQARAALAAYEDSQRQLGLSRTLAGRKPLPATVGELCWLVITGMPEFSSEERLVLLAIVTHCDATSGVNIEDVLATSGGPKDVVFDCLSELVREGLLTLEVGDGEMMVKLNLPVLS